MIPALFFPCDVQHAMDLSAVLRHHGAKVYPVSGKTPHAERQRLVRMACAGEIDGLASCDALTVGTDIPIATLAGMVKPSTSGLWYRQAVGRVLRRCPAPQGERPYQREALVAIYRALQRGCLSQVMVLPCGTGKTTIAAQFPKMLKAWKGDQYRGRLIFLVHRDELAFQAAETFQRFNPALRVGIEKAGSYAENSDIVIASVQTVGVEKDTRLRSFSPLRFDAVIQDECFVAGTLVDGRPIETLRAGDVVSCVDESALRLSSKPILHVFRNRATRLVRIKTGCQTITCTPNHPIFSPLDGRYIPAAEIRVGSIVLGSMCEAGGGHEEDRVLGLIRVEGVEVLEPGRDGEFERVCPDGIVYNIEVESFHNYFANGILAHNCHFGIRSALYKRIFKHFEVLKGQPDRSREILNLGMTATPNRADNVGLEEQYDQITYVYELTAAITQGWLSRIKAFRAETRVDISQVRMRSDGDDLRIAELEKTVNTPERNELIAEKYLEVCAQEGMSRVQGWIRPDPWEKPHAIVLDFADLSGKHSLITAPTLFGFAPRYNARGGDLLADADKVKKIREEHPNLDLREAPDMSAIETTLHSVDLLAPPRIPPEIRQCSRFAWLPDGPGAYHLGCMDRRIMTVRQNALGQWDVTEHTRGMANQIYGTKTLKEALQLAEKRMPKQEQQTLQTGAAWQSEPPSERQAGCLWNLDRRLQGEYDKPIDYYRFCRRQHESGNPNYSKGALSRAITALDAQSRGA
jgi:superfamily II DNA or RNA helicase